MARGGTANWRADTYPVRLASIQLGLYLIDFSCQCGISRSATLVIAYVMSLAASGLLPDLLGHLSGMQDAYEFVKCQSPWIGPNVS